MNHPGDRIWQRRMSRRDFLWLASVTTTGAALAGCATDPITGKSRLMLMSEADEIELDKQYAPHQFSNDYGRVRDDGLDRYLTQVGSSIGAVSHRPHMPYSYHAVNANYVNAYTFPGGTMACTRGILVDMQDEAALAGLLGHETGHVTARHMARRQTQQLLAALALGGVALAAAQSDHLAGYSNLIYAVGAIGAGALLAYYSRENEREADSLGLQYMAEAGYNPEGMVDLMAMLQKLSDRDPNALELMFATHPMSRERFETAQRESQVRYAEHLDRNVGRERYLDNTARLRQLRPTIVALRAGEADMARKRYPQAEKQFTEGLKQAPDDYCGLVLMAECLSAQGRQREAQRYLNQAKTVYPEEGKALHLSGINHLALKRPDVALAEFQAYERVLPGNPNSLFLQGVAYESMQNRTAAREHYQRYLQLAGDTEQARYAVQRLQQWQ
ncbi:MAG: M48 family metalloprotease [Gammaproteobacteria bacterium]